MKKNFFGLLVAGMAALSLTACNNSGENDADNDSLNRLGDSVNNTTGSTSATSSNDYSAFADSVERNSQSGYYLNAKTGKPLKLKVDRTSGAVTDESTGEPVWRYVDSRSWWVYGLDMDDNNNWYWDTMGEAKQNNDKITYKSDNNAWVDYDKRWMETDQKLEKGWKTKIGDTKIKFGKDGDIKIKDESGKTKYDADDNKIKTDTSD